MNTRNSPPTLLLTLIFALTCAGTASLTVWAADAKTSDAKSTTPKSEKTKSEKTVPAPKDDKRPPLKISVDTRPVNRDAADRVSYAPIIKKTASSVVYVHSSKTVRGQDMTPFLNDPLLRRFFDLPGLQNPDDESGNSNPRTTPKGNNRKGNRNRDGGGNSGNNTPRNRLPDQVQQGLGSGIVITPDGYILTNNHVIDGADDVKVSIGDAAKRYEAKVIGRDSFGDIAVLKIDATGLTPATFGDSEQLQVGDVVLAIGNPFGVGQSVSRGIVSALGRGVGMGPLEDFIQTDAAINPGNSGGALLDTDGRVVGINTAIVSGSGGFAGVGFAIPINLARNIAEQLVNKGRVDRAFLGVGAQDLSDELIGQFGAEKGALVTEVSPDSPAEKAGIKQGDVITKVNATEIVDYRHLLLTISSLAPDSQATIDYLRDGKKATANVRLARRPEQPVASNDSPAPNKDEGVLNGVGVGDITPQMRDQLQIPQRIQGAIITSVDPDSPSAKQGLREGDIILQLDQKIVTNAEEAVKASEEIKGPKVAVLVWRNGQRSFKVIDESRE